MEVSPAFEKLRGAGEGSVLKVPDLNIEMVYLRPGTFAMGSPDSESKERPVTRVTLTKGYGLGKTAVTQGQWEALMGNNPARFNGEDHPVEMVSWNDAMEFCTKLTERERQAGRVPDGYEYTLPTEAQWEYACRAGTTGDYAGNLDSMAWYSRNSGKTTHRVGQRQPNAWGLHEMHGNVWEWCRDWFGSYAGFDVTDPVGPSWGSTRVYRGACWVNDPGDCRSAHRDSLDPGTTSYRLGFRVALAPMTKQ
jgi:formylglycine-generating enzyme required for sulfatase activity